MAFKLAISNTVTVPVEGHIPDAAGRKAPFSFRLVCRRLPADELRQAIDANDATVPEFLAGVVTGWEGVQGDDGHELTYTGDGLRELLNIVGMAGVCFQAYLSACGARGKEKN